MARKRLGEILVDARVITSKQLSYALQEQQRWGGQLGAILIQEGFVSEDLLIRALGKQLSLPLVSLAKLSVAVNVLAKVEADFARQHGIMPFRIEGKFLDVAMGDPMSMGIIDELRILTQLNVRPYLAMPSEIKEALISHYGKGEVQDDRMAIDFETSFGGADGLRSRDGLAEMRDAEIASLQRRLAKLEALVKRDEDVIRKLMGLLVEKGVASRDEILAAIR